MPGILAISFNLRIVFSYRHYFEGDQHAVRCLAYTFIDRSFDREYYKLYKSTFSATEWPNKLSELLNKYDKNVLYFSESKANVLVEEGDL